MSGTVIDETGAPAPDIRVMHGKTIVTTDTAGHFSFSNVGDPYGLAIAHAGQEAFVFDDLTTATPILRASNLYLSPTGGGMAATLSLQLPIEQGSTDKTGYVIDRPDDLSPIETFVANETPTGQIPMTIRWPGNGATTIRIQAFRYQADANGAPQHYTGYDTVMLALTPGTPASWTAAWKAPSFAEAPLSASVTLPAGYKIWQTTVSMRPTQAPSSSFGFAYTLSPATALAVVVPKIDGVTYEVSVCASSVESTSCRTSRGLTAGATPAKITVDPGPTLVSPGEGDAVGIGSKIKWNAAGTSAAFVLFYPSNGEGPSYQIATNADSTTIPDLAAMGVTLPKGADYILEVFRNDSLPSVDDLAEKGAVFSADGDSTYAYSSAHTVKTF